MKGRSLSHDPNEPDALAEVQIPRTGFWAHMRGYFVAGVLVVAPVGLTVWIAWKILTVIDSWITPFIPKAYNPNSYLNMLAPFSNWNIPGVGLIVLIIALILVGLLTRMFVGRYLVHYAERLVGQMPVLRNVYGALKQIFETVLAHKSDAFRQVVMLEYPRRGMWALGFVTGTTEGEVQHQTSDEVVNVFLPTTPNPTSGFLLFMPRRELVYLSMSVEEAAKMIISGGIVTPPDRRPKHLQDQPVIGLSDGDTPTISPDTNPTGPGGPRLVESSD